MRRSDRHRNREVGARQFVGGEEHGEEHGESHILRDVFGCDRTIIRLQASLPGFVVEDRQLALVAGPAP